MTILTIAEYLIGDRRAIEQIAGHRSSIWIGLLFVLSAGLAREYDGESLLHEPWHLLLPLVASFGTATLLYVLLWIVLHGWKTFPHEGEAYRAFLALYWMTAPLAWLYAIPVERFLGPLEATQANLWFLAIVALWRVVLITRVASVVFHVHFGRVFFPVMLFADTVMLAAIAIVPLPIISVMGGVRLSPSENVILGTTILLRVFGSLSWPIWALGTVIGAFMPRNIEPLPAGGPGEARIAKGVWGLAIGLLVFGFALLPFAQPEQQRRWQAEHLLTSGRVEEGLAYMSRFRRDEFPSHWDPPPRIAWQGDQGPPLRDVIDKLFVTDRPAWVTELYIEKVGGSLETFPHLADQFWERMSDEDFEGYMTILERFPLDEVTRRTQQEGLRNPYVKFENRSPEQVARLKKALGIKDVDIPRETPAGDASGDQSTEPMATEPGTPE